MKSEDMTKIMLAALERDLVEFEELYANQIIMLEEEGSSLRMNIADLKGKITALKWVLQ